MSNPHPSNTANQCYVCGKFFSQTEIDNDEIIIDYTPETDTGLEQIRFAHQSCEHNKKIYQTEDLISFGNYIKSVVTGIPEQHLSEIRITKADVDDWEDSRIGIK